MLVVSWGQSSYISHSNSIDKYDKLVNLAVQYDKHKETTSNRSKEIDKFNRFCNVPLSSPYCTSFICTLIDSTNKTIPKNDSLVYKKTALAQAFKGRYTKNINKILLGLETVQKGDILIWAKGKTILGHSGLVIKNWNGKSGLTIQANTNSQTESRDGQGIYIKTASIQPFNYFRIIRVIKL